MEWTRLLGRPARRYRTPPATLAPSHRNPQPLGKMPLTLVVTRDVVARYRGFLSSVMPEIAPGVYISPDLNAAVRERVWAVMERWWEHAPGAAVVLAYADKGASGRLAVRTLGTPPVELADIDGMRVVVRQSPSASR